MTLRTIGNRIRVDCGVSGPEIVVRAPRNWLLLAFLPVWLAGWTFGGVAAILSFVRAPQLFIGVWLVGWVFGEALGLLAWLWGAFGEEVVAIDSGALRLVKRIGRFRRERRYALQEVSNMRALGWFGSPTSFSESLRPWGLTGGTVAFDYRAKPVRFGISLDEQDARDVARELAPYVREAA